MLTSPTPAIRRPMFQDWGPAALVALLCIISAGLALPHATHSVTGACTVLVLLGTAGILGWKSRPERVPPERLALAVKALSGQVVLQLEARAGDALGRAGLAYAAVARSDSAEVVLAQAYEPASVLAVARYWQTHLEAPLLPGWGLVKGDIEALDAKRVVSLPRVDYSSPSQHGLAGSTVSILCSAVALLLLAGSVAIFRQHPASGVSLMLLGVGTSILALLGAATRSDVTRIFVQDALEVERRCLSFKLRSIRLPLDQVRVLAIVSPDGRHGRHLVLAATNGFWSIECPTAPVVRDPVVALRPPLNPPPRERRERAPRVVSGSAH